jgi:membrane fusion protein, adhesin transport system
MTRLKDRDFMPDRIVAETEAAPLLTHGIVLLTALFVLIALVWANFASLEEVARAQGRVISSTQIQTIQNLEGGIIAEVMVSNGDLVVKGQPLVRIDDTRFASSFNQSQSSIDALQYRAVRLAAELSGENLSTPKGLGRVQLELFKNEVSLYQTRKIQLQSSLEILKQQLKQHIQAKQGLLSEYQKFKTNADLARQELELTTPAVKTGAVSKIDLLRLQRAVNEADGLMEETRLKLPSAEAVLEEARKKIDERNQQFLSTAQAEFTEVTAELNRLTFSNAALEDRVARTSVRSPVEGIVNQVLVNTIGAVVQPGMDLIEIAPSNDTLLVDAKIRPADIAFIRPGQAATVKLTAYDYSIYGGLEAVLERISADTIIDESGEHFFKIQVRTEKNYLGSSSDPLPIIPGMTATVDIMTGRKTVMDYLLKPLKRAQANALRER